MVKWKTCGVYKITNLITNEFYVGSSYDVRARYSCHMGRDARKYSKLGHRFYVDIIKYGKENFKLELLEECKREDKIEREQYWYDKLKPTYNKVRPEYNNFKYKWIQEKATTNSNTEEHVQKRKELYNTDEYKEYFRNVHVSQMKSVIMIKDGIEIKTFKSLQEAGRYISETTEYKGKNKTSKIKAVCDGERPSAYGYEWRYSKV